MLIQAYFQKAASSLNARFFPLPRHHRGGVWSPRPVSFLPIYSVTGRHPTALPSSLKRAASPAKTHHFLTDLLYLSRPTSFTLEASFILPFRRFRGYPPLPTTCCSQ